jgi:hypothetical protein
MGIGPTPQRQRLGPSAEDLLPFIRRSGKHTMLWLQACGRAFKHPMVHEIPLM